MLLASKFTLEGVDSIFRFLFYLEGSIQFNGKMVNTIFKWIVESGRNVTYRIFIPNGFVTGLPNKFVW